MGVPDYGKLTPNQLLSLYVHNRIKTDDSQETAAFGGYCGGNAFGLAFSGELKEFHEFYHIKRPYLEKPLDLTGIAEVCKKVGIKPPRIP